MQKFKEIFLKLGFIIVYSTPLSWASGFHIVMQPLGIPFSQFFFVQLIYSVLSNSPMYPLIGGALWFLGYSRGAKFWEKDYRSKRRDVSNQTLGQTLGGGAMDQHTTNNLNSIFYEHLVNALRTRMSEIMRKGQLGPFEQGDIFMFINDNLTAIVHIIEVGNGVVSYQIRGLEFKGTICQEEEQRAILSRINRDQEGMPGFSACEEPCFPGAPKVSLLSAKDMITLRMHTWQVIQTGVKLRTYNMLENKVENLMSSNDERKEVIVLYVRAVLFYVIHAQQLDSWIGDASPFLEAFTRITDRKADFDPMFSEKFDPDYDTEIGLGGVSFKKFVQIYTPFIDYFIDERMKEKNSNYDENKKLNIQKLAYLASLTARRALASFDGSNSANSLRTFIQKVHQLFVGDYRITSTNDEWVFGDLSILDHCIKPAIGMSLSLYQSKFAAEDVDLPDVVSTLIKYDMVITHESDPKWRESIMAEEAAELFSLRKKVQDKGGVDYYILMLSMRDIEFNIVKMNREGVRALWSSQQHELLYLGVEEAERGSIQNMTYTLRNICNSCMDVPIGYPVMVSSVTTAYW
ncbi:predicted protein [Naegleria gruberi]|uniref:Predicted protein n=1 Tax=Naegleria gruberi TaxID=5762 RepID=D2VSJ2_NAEGR|nr:uncharacterized protein NAEGRDRAFT_56304 [Naegleria gruberi]EFC40202.1 predicted protein [Naegleria gruberi]|eukprot:XP_002672946.1 predicted protein [Naegleria gruberi strain NEG-M]